MLRARRRAFGFRPGGDYRDEPRRDHGRSVARRGQHFVRGDCVLEEAGLLLPLSAVRPQGTPAQQERRTAEGDRRCGRLRRRDDVRAVPQARDRGDGRGLHRGDRLRGQPGRRGRGRHRHGFHAGLQHRVLRHADARQGPLSAPDQLRQGDQPRRDPDHRRVSEPDCGDGASWLEGLSHPQDHGRELGTRVQGSVGRLIPAPPTFNQITTNGTGARDTRALAGDAASAQRSSGFPFLTELPRCNRNCQSTLIPKPVSGPPTRCRCFTCRATSSRTTTSPSKRRSAARRTKRSSTRPATSPPTTGATRRHGCTTSAGWPCSSIT
ncbi:hypothetical protein CBM2588_B190108 [Cupriavidus taiwanensis]|nr:hypothetical protein CBM2588_B190108 [Cupriavidus taiwanensis]